MTTNYEDLITKYSATVFRCAYSYVNNRTDAEDIMQEVFLKYLVKKPVFNIDCPSDISVMADEFHIRNLLATIIDNAIKYAADPIVGIRVREDEDVTVEIEDNGCGIAKEHLGHIFEKFYRVPTGDVHTVRGYGLGLYYAKQVVELHKGTISIRSRVGKGTTVTIKLPGNEQ